MVRMLEQYLGAEEFRSGITEYLRRHVFGTTETTDLWDALEDVTGEPVRRIMDNWIFRGGHPLVRVDRADDGFTMDQTRGRVRPEAEWGPLADPHGVLGRRRRRRSCRGAAAARGRGSLRHRWSAGVRAGQRRRRRVSTVSSWTRTCAVTCSPTVPRTHSSVSCCSTTPGRGSSPAGCPLARSPSSSDSWPCPSWTRRSGAGCRERRVSWPASWARSTGRRSSVSSPGWHCRP